MPAYPWLATNKVDHTTISAHMRALSRVGVPLHSGEQIAAAQKVQGKTRNGSNCCLFAKLRFGASKQIRCVYVKITLLVLLHGLFTDLFLGVFLARTSAVRQFKMM